jgi:hypothetical protein
MSEIRIYDYVMLLQSAAVMVRPDPMLIAPIRETNRHPSPANAYNWRGRGNLHN